MLKPPASTIPTATLSPPLTKTSLPRLVYLLGLIIFSIGTSEFMIAGMLPSLTQAFNVSVAQVGYLIAFYALGMVLGGPLLSAVLLALRIPNKRALLGLLGLYAMAQAMAAMTSSYTIMALARVSTGIVGAACIGVALAICADLVPLSSRGRAVSIVIGGLMLATVLGVPVATWVDLYLGWRASFWLITVLLAVCALLILLCLAPTTPTTEKLGLTAELAQFKNRHLWAAYTTSGLIIGAVFAMFSYLALILTEMSGFASATIPWLLALYGATNVLGNIVIGRYAEQHTFLILRWGLIILSLALALFALLAHLAIPSLVLLIVIGLVGIPLNPAMIARVMQTAHSGVLINTVHTSVINIGLALGAWLGGISIAHGYGLRSPLWIGALLALLGLLSLLPYRGRKTAR